MGERECEGKKLVQGGLVLLLFITAGRQCAQGLRSHTGDTFFDGPYMQTKGTASLLVIPVDFPDEPSMTGSTSQLNEISFGGGGSALASVADYYSRSSYGELAITGQVQEWYRAKHDRSYYSKEGDQVFIEEILEAMMARGWT
ncbi:MAG: immune inhibitor A domain-containing protein [Clostridia bacterium]